MDGIHEYLVKKVKDYTCKKTDIKVTENGCSIKNDDYDYCLTGEKELTNSVYVQKYIKWCVDSSFKTCTFIG